MPEEKKPTSESKLLSSLIERREIKLKVYHKEMAEWNSNGRDKRHQCPLILCKG